MFAAAILSPEAPPGLPTQQTMSAVTGAYMLHWSGRVLVTQAFWPGSCCCVAAAVLTGITFAGVHDSFWTHAGTVPQMNKVLRDTFVQLHTQQVGCF